MAEAIFFDIGRNILSQLSSQPVQEIGQWWNVEHELKKLEKTISTIQAVLLDAEEEREPSHQFKHWLGELRQVLYDAEEVVDDFATEALRQKVMTNGLLPKEVKLFFSSSKQLVYGIKMAHKIKGIREALDDITNDRQKFHFSESRSKTLFMSSEGRDKVVLFRQEEKVVSDSEEKFIGREVEKKAIIDRLLGKGKEDDVISRHGVPVIAIVGSGGLGKTTLSRLVYDDSEVKSHFELQMWVFVGDVDFNTREIAEKATSFAVETKESKMQEVGSGAKREAVGVESDKIREFKKLIRGKRFLLVLDDVWSEDHNKWVDLEDLWRDCRSESGIIVTSSSVDVAKMMRSKLYRLGYLSPSDSWSLFVKIVFGGKELENKEVLENGKKIIAKCGGVPLAIKAIGNMLYSLNPETEWLPYVTNELLKYPQANNNIFPTLRLSYDNLPSPLKYCFAYCSLFPKGYIIDVQILIQFWIAQGYIRPPEMGESLEDISLQYCKVLVSRSFFQEEIVDEISGNLAFCRMHDIMHELATFVAGDETVCSYSIYKDIGRHTRHLSFGFYHNDVSFDNPNLGHFPPPILESMLKATKLRTFFSSVGFFRGSYAITKDECKNVFEKLSSLMVLDLRNLNIESMINYDIRSYNIPNWVVNCFTSFGFGPYRIPKSIGRLKHLRYLDLNKQPIVALPKSITKLYNLQVLKLYNCENLKELPKDIKNLISLRVLDCYLCGSLTYMPCGLGKLTSLQTLTRFVVAPGGSKRSKHMARLDELSHLNLRDELEIDNLWGVEVDESEFLGAYLKQKDRLLTMSLDWNRDSDTQSPPDNDEMVLQRLEPHSNLKKMAIRCQYLPPLGGLHSLRRLYIDFCDDLEYIDGTRSGSLATSPTTFFPSLKFLIVYRCDKLKGWWNMEKDNNDDKAVESMELPHFPCLSSLWIAGCPLLICMPLFSTLNGELYLSDSSIEPLQRTLKSTIQASPSSSSSTPLVHPLSELKKLSFLYMKDLACLPEEGMHHLTSLQFLDIFGCPHLKERCGNKKGGHWHKISHIPYIEVEEQYIQIEGHYQLAESTTSTPSCTEIEED